jgi:D-glycero-D-manno-heptose 1,7-bisphosphate phosphatase
MSSSERRTKRPAVFLDRDGTLNEPPEPGGYVLRPEDLRLVAEAGEATRRLKDAGFFLCLATNQRCVAIDLISLATLDAIHQRMQNLLREQGGAPVDAIFACVENRDSPRRKPHPTMLLEAAEAHHLDLARSWMVGDSIKDAQAGLAAGARSILVEHPGSPELREGLTPELRDKIFVVPDLKAAADVILADSNVVG